MRKMRIISLLAVIVLLVSSLGLCTYAAEETQNALTATVESTVLIAGDDPVTVKISSGKIVDAKSSDENVVTFDLASGKITPVGKGDATITITNDSGDVTTLDVKVYSSALSLGIETTLLGMGIVFAVLIIIWAILAVFGRIATAGQKNPKPTPAPKASATPAPTPVAVTPAPAASDDSELVAAITAAVSLCMDMPIGSFRVVSFRKTNTKQAWNKK